MMPFNLQNRDSRQQGRGSLTAPGRFWKRDLFFTRLNDSGRERTVTVFFLVPFLVILVSLVVFFVVREKRSEEEAQLSELTESAEAFYEQIAVARLWNAQHGGLYAEVTPQTPPNPYLDPAGRDIRSADGRTFTKINPAYMTRQLSDIANSRHGYRFRIVGLHPLNPANAPDPWEAEALRAAASGKNRPSGMFFEADRGRRMFKYLVPLVIEPACLSCHQQQGYRTGDVKGGVVISIPLEKYDAIAQERMKKTMAALLSTGALGILFAVLITAYLSRRLSQEFRKNVEREKLAAAMELAGATAHELRQPMTVVMCAQHMLRSKVSEGGSVTGEELDLVESQCGRMNEIIERLLTVTEYRTKQYAPGVRIFDLEAAAPQPGTETLP